MGCNGIECMFTCSMLMFVCVYFIDCKDNKPLNKYFQTCMVMLWQSILVQMCRKHLGFPIKVQCWCSFDCIVCCGYNALNVWQTQSIAE